MAAPFSLRSLLSRTAIPSKTFPNGSSALGGYLPTASFQRYSFSSTPEYNNRRPRRDNNRLRGLSSIHRSGTRFRMNIDQEEAPKPAKYKPKVKVDPNHGLYDFFYSKDRLVLKPDEIAEHGRAWTVEELRHKSWEDLHQLWWACAKEQNRIATARKVRARLRLMEGGHEENMRQGEVRKTMKAIRHTLTERWYVWEDARKLAENDPEIDLNNTESPFTPSAHFEAEGTPKQNEQAGQEPSGFMAEEATPATPDKIDPSTIPSHPTETQQPLAKP
ncbi:mitochondrial 39-S ribosomal protein L47 (MRP-L47)-domain-containing protein [Xylariaceae sp. FL0594]|nr:mitochondrial 39-S ribosomal protein L47 (MRP-L47)-domain-containing protein [Xylariaceae sp. FL0594]